MARQRAVASIDTEFVGAALGDARLDQRLLRIARSLEADPAGGFPRALGSEAELEGFYRFINNDSFRAEDVLTPHVTTTLERARMAREVVVVHDTTPVEYSDSSAREGLGWTTSGGRQGFFAHVSLVLDMDGLPLGVSNVETLTRSGTKERRRKQSHKVVRDDPRRESLRWLRGVNHIEDAREDSFEAVHVTDAEGDFFELLGTLCESDARFVIRAGQLDRRIPVDDCAVPLRDLVDQVTARAFRHVELSARKHPKRAPRANRIKHPDRHARVAKLAIGATTITMQKTRYSDFAAEPFDVNVVRVWDSVPAAGEPPVEWVLLTTEPIATPDDLKRIVDIYRLRWTIEEYFKALKTGCSLEKRQVESYDALRNVLALFVPIAYRLLLLRALHRRAPNAKVSAGFTPTELHLMANAPSNRGLPPALTLQDGLMHLARLGGHLKNNGDPGWLTLARGYEKLLLLHLGWTLAQRVTGSCDQS